MSTLAIMAIIAIVSSIGKAVLQSYQQNNEFEQQQTLQEDAQDFAHSEAELAWERQRPQQVWDDYRSLGFNPNLAAASIMGVGSETASAASSPSAPSVNSAIDALQRSVGTGGQNLYDLFLKQAQIENLNSQSNFNDVQSGLLPKEYELKRLSTAKQLDVWDKSIEEANSRIHLNEEVTNLYKEQVEYYGRMSEAQIAVYEQQVQESIKRCKVMDEEILNKRKEREVMDSEIAVNYNEAFNLAQQGVKAAVETEGISISNDRQQIALDFENSIDAPLSADAQQYVNKLISEGKYDEVEQFYLNLFNIAKNQKPPHIEGGIPGIYRYSDYGIGTSKRNRSNAIIWTPDLREKR